MPDVGHHTGPFSQVLTGMADAVEREIRQHLAVLAEHGTETTIDLRSLPLSDADRDALQDMLGKGEVAATVDSMGVSEIWETGHAGVWWVRHRGTEGEVTSELVEIAFVPHVLKADPADVKAAAETWARKRDVIAVE